MPKPMRMMIEVEELAFGRVFRTLDGMQGVIAIDIKGDGPKKGQCVPKAQGGKTINEIIFDALNEGPKARKQLEHELARNGKAPTSIGSALTALRKSKRLKLNATTGQYSLADKKGSK